MKKIVKRAKVGVCPHCKEAVYKKTVSYKCFIGGEKYKTAKRAEECEALGVEPQKYKVGDLVINVRPRLCDNFKEHRFIGIVVKVFGPALPPDDVADRMNLGGINPVPDNIHLYQYEIEYDCPVCKQEKKALYYGVAIRKCKDNEVILTDDDRYFL